LSELINIDPNFPVKLGVGLGTFLSYQVEDLVGSGELKILLPEFELPASPVSVVYPSTKLMSARVKIFVDWITDKLRQEMARLKV
jgi:DNA-binding transcriptional LysR family regulator